MDDADKPAPSIDNGHRDYSVLLHSVYDRASKLICFATFGVVVITFCHTDRRARFLPAPLVGSDPRSDNPEHVLLLPS